MAEPAKKKAVYEDLFGLPENMTGEIINGELIVTPRPSRKHALAATVLGAKVTAPYYLAEGGGPGGWIILIEPEIRFGEDLLVPDLAGWRKERFPLSEETNWISVAPDWACEITSPHTAGIDKVEKMAVYGRYGVPYVWLLDPLARTLEAFGLESGRWVVLGFHAGRDRVRAEPFKEVEIDLGWLWLEE
jgi:Uma2 family endonuclease